MRTTSLVLTVALLLVPATWSAELAGVEMPDSFEMDGRSLQLNGLGLREATMLKVDVYVAGLYVESTSGDAEELLASDQAWRLHMKFVRKVGAKSIADAWSAGFKKNVKGHGDLKGDLEKLNSFMSDMEDGDTMTFAHVPGAGLSVSVRGAEQGSIPDDTFARGMLSVFLGPKPPNAGLKSGLLGE